MKYMKTKVVAVLAAGIVALPLTGCAPQAVPVATPTPPPLSEPTSEWDAPGDMPTTSSTGQPTTEPTSEWDWPGQPTESTQTFTKAELSFLKGREVSADDDEAVDEVEEGHDTCTKLDKKKTVLKRAVFLANEYAYDGDVYDVSIKYLCPKHAKAWKVYNSLLDDGTHNVGGKNGIKPGVYRTVEAGLEDCYWSRVTKGGRILDNDFIDYAPGHVTVTVRPSDGGFKTNGCGLWVRS